MYAVIMLHIRTLFLFALYYPKRSVDRNEIFFIFELTYRCCYNNNKSRIMCEQNKPLLVKFSLLKTLSLPKR